MPKLKYTKQECVSKLIELQDMIGWDKGLTQDILEKNKIYKTVLTHWGSITNMRNELHLPELGINNHGKYSKNELIKILDDFIKQYGFFPSSEYWDKNQKELKLPSSAVYIRYFKSWKNLRELFNYSNGNYIKNRDGIFVNKYDNKAELCDLLKKYINENNKIPTIKELQKTYTKGIKYYIEKYFDTYINFLNENGYTSRSSQKYTDNELEKYFMLFVDKNHRVPTIREFNDIKEYPSVKSYVNRFGSWGNACRYYGFNPNERQPKYYLDNGEICDSSFEFKVSNWLLNNDIQYIRNVPYKNLDSIYKGTMNCDYMINFKGINWYVEIAGMLNSRDYIPTSSETILYHKKLHKKEQILQRNNLNYKFIYGNDFKKFSIEELFDFLTN